MLIAIAAPHQVYSHADLRAVVAHAADRGIRVRRRYKSAAGIPYLLLVDALTKHV